MRYDREFIAAWRRQVATNFGEGFKVNLIENYGEITEIGVRHPSDSWPMFRDIFGEADIRPDRTPRLEEVIRSAKAFFGLLRPRFRFRRLSMNLPAALRRKVERKR